MSDIFTNLVRNLRAAATYQLVVMARCWRALSRELPAGDRDRQLSVELRAMAEYEQEMSR